MYNQQSETTENKRNAQSQIHIINSEWSKKSYANTNLQTDEITNQTSSNTAIISILSANKYQWNSKIMKNRLTLVDSKNSM